MNNNQKKELKRRVKEIHPDEYGNKIVVLWERHGDGFTYGTFRRYFLWNKERVKEEIKQNENKKS